MNEIRELNEMITQLDSNIDSSGKLKPDISRSPVGWHIEHSLLTINGIAAALQRSDPEKYKWKMNPIRTLVFSTNRIPRGRAQAPSIVVPGKNITDDHLRQHIEITKEKIKTIENLSPDKYFEHPFFGNLKLKKTLKFLIIHTRHHLEIINEIQSA